MTTSYPYQDRPDSNQDQTLITSKSTKNHSLTPPSPYLIILFPTEWFERIPLKQTPMVIGRGQQADIRLPDELMSRQHCEIHWNGKQLFVQDLNSTNGTFINGHPITEKTELASDERLMIGHVILKIEYKDSSEVEREQALFEAATTDPLTRIPNRRFFLDRAQAEFSASRRMNRWLHCIMLDVDHFKKINDTWGHATGDFILKEIAALLLRQRREEDLLARWGGEEFIYLLSGIDATQSLRLAERIRQNIANHRFVWKETPIPVTASLGVSSFQAHNLKQLDDLFAEADRRLYQAKKAGRNQVGSTE